MRPDLDLLAPDGFRYGVMFGDRSIRQRWNGRTQREHAEAEAARLAREYPGSHITPARARPDGAWERY